MNGGVSQYSIVEGNREHTYIPYYQHAKVLGSSVYICILHFSHIFLMEVLDVVGR